MAETDATQLPLSFDELAGTDWLYYHLNTTAARHPLRLQRDGHIGAYNHRNEYRWDVVDGTLCFFSIEGKATVTFSDVARGDGLYSLKGSYVPQPIIKLGLDQQAREQPSSTLVHWAQISAADLATDSIELAPGRLIDLPAAMIASNLTVDNPFFPPRQFDEVYYSARRADIEAIMLHRLPPGVTVLNGGHYVTIYRDKLLREQYPVYAGKLIRHEDLLVYGHRVQQIDGEKLLVARYGITTWGHWLGELLPKILLTERAFPGRFQYVLPSNVLLGEQAAPIWSSIKQSLTVCGVDLNRVFPMDEASDHEFGSLSVVSPTWSSHIIHPDASDVLRQSVAAISPATDTRLAILRVDAFGRELRNAAAVHALLRERNFVSKQTGTLSFADQVSAFKAGSMIFGVLGSDLTNLIFAPPGVKVVTAAPQNFGDRFFYALVLDRGGLMSDLRGPIVAEHEIFHKASFTLDLDLLRTALSALGA